MSETGVNVIVQKMEGRSPANDLDFQMMMVDGRWGDKNLDADLRDRLKTSKFLRIKAGSVVINSDKEETIIDHDTLIPTEVFLWGELSFFTRDFRLGNLSPADYEEAKHFTLLAADCLRLGMHRAFTVCLSRVAAILELSQSKKGFLRELLGKKHNVNENREIMETPTLLMPKKHS
jgi:hypothetical protein